MAVRGCGTVAQLLHIEHLPVLDEAVETRVQQPIADLRPRQRWGGRHCESD